MSPTMEHAMVSAATGVLSPVIGKLSTLLEKKYASLKGVSKEIASLKEELSSMNAMLLKLAAEDNPDVQVKEWGNQIRDLSYDIEDCIDDFMLRVELHGHEATDQGFLQKSMAKLKTLGARHDIAGKIRELKTRADDVSKRHSRYIFQGSSSSSSSPGCADAAAVAIDPRLQALYAAEESLVGIEQPRDELIKLLNDGEGELANKLKVVHIVGFGGLGKTTLANQVRLKLGQHFDCRVFVSASQNPHMLRLLSKILIDELQEMPSIHTNVQDMIDKIKSHLLNKRYLVVIDDLWDRSVWTVLRCAFPENNLGSRVITTTRVKSVAATCCGDDRECIYKMNPLNEEDSRRLFFNRIFGSEDECPSEIKAVSSEILKKCDGLPLAIITIASLLASHQQATNLKEGWEHVQSSLGSNLATDADLEGMRQILNLSYKYLPPHLKTCFLYLGAYPEDYIIWKDDLVRQWIAEGFVNKTDGRAAEIGGHYFNDLVNRSMIQPVRIGYNDEVLSCRVHDMMLDLIIGKYSYEENFLSAVRNSLETKFRSTHNVRRLFHYSDVARHRAMPEISIDLKKVRSLAACGTSIHKLMFLDCRFLRVLVLDIVEGIEEKTPAAVDLTTICKLLLLRYLKIKSEVRLKLPTQIRMLQYLETLEISIRSRSVVDVPLPSDIVQLPCLSYLNILPRMARLPDGIGTMACLRSLAFFVLEESSLESIKSLRRLTGLREIYMISCSSTSTTSAVAMSHMDALQSSLSGLDYCKLYLRAWSALLPVVPQWVGQLRGIYGLELGVVELPKDGVSVLAGLPALVRLDLWIRSDRTESVVVAGAGFPALKALIFTCSTLCLTFEEGAMPKLQDLMLEFNADETEHGDSALIGVEHLSSLKKISASVGGFGATILVHATKEALSAMNHAIRLHPGRPRVEVSCLQGRFLI